MELGEVIAVLTVKPEEGRCPFCDSKDKDGDKTKEMENDSAKLAKNLGSMPKIMALDPIPLDEDYYIKGDYEIEGNSTQSYICLNAHHVLPGNAALAEAKTYLKWLAGTVTMKKKFQDDKIEVKVKKVTKKNQDATRKQLYEEKYKNEKFYGDPNFLVIFSTTDGKSGATRGITVADKWVTGEVPFDVNEKGNGVWLPSNNAIINWGQKKSIRAQDIQNKTTTLGHAYALNTMVATLKHFHDSHGEYSDEVLNMLEKLADEVEKLAEKCHMHESSSKKGGPYPAPTRLAWATFRLAKKIRDKLDLGKGDPEGNWVTSKYVHEVY